MSKPNFKLPLNLLDRRISSCSSPYSQTSTNQKCCYHEIANFYSNSDLVENSSVCDILKQFNPQDYQNYVDFEGQPLFILAIISHDNQAVKYLISKGSNVNCQDSNGRTPLMWACNIGNVEAVNMLLDVDTLNFDTVDEDGCTAFHFAAEGEDDTIFEKFIVTGFDCQTCNNYGEDIVKCLQRNRDYDRLDRLKLLLGLS